MSRNHFGLHAARWSRVRRFVFKRDCYRCTRCGKAGRLECDHIKPLADGGEPYEPANLRTLCRGCHILVTRQQNRRPPTPNQAAWRALVAHNWSER